MSDLSKHIAALPPEQEAIRAKCFHPSGKFVEFKKEEVEQSIPDRFEQIVRRYPDRIAVKTKDQTLTYNELNRAANRVAHAILARYGKGNEPIPLLFKQGASIITASLGALKAGKAYVPVDCSLPRARATHILQDIQVGLIVVDYDNLSLARELARDPSKVLSVDDLDANLSDDNPGLWISPDHLAYIHYTSGSTGEPKGVVENHRNELHNIMKNTNALRISPDDRVSLLRSNNAGAARDTLLALLNGASLFPLDLKEEGLANLGRWLIEEEITVYTCVTTIFRHSVRTLTGEENFPKLRLIHVGGEPVYKTDVELYKKHFSDECMFVNRFSASETEAVAYYFINKETEIKGEMVPVGYPLEGNEILLLDKEGKEVGVNRVGEIAVKSQHLALGYWRQPELTRKKFLPDPSGGSKRIYLTGDLGYRLPDGCLVHVGRRDFQVKVRGHRVEIAEIETALLGVAAIKQAAVVPWEDSLDGKRLVAYVAPRPGQAPTIGQLRSFLNEKLPSYMLPSSIVILDRLPITPSGKVDRQALPPPERSRHGLDLPYIEARTPVEKVLVKLWTEFMGIDDLGVHDDFSELGGNSLLAARLASRVNDTFSLKCPLNVVFEAPTVAKLSEWLIEHETNPGQTEKIASILLKIESMSAQDISAAITEEKGKRGNA